MPANVERSRFVRGMIIDLLVITDRVGNSFGLSGDQIRGGFMKSQVAIQDSEIRSELNDLAGDGIIEKQWDADLGEDYYKITSDGRDFKRAGCPWHEVDRFTGKVGQRRNIS